MHCVAAHVEPSAALAGLVGEDTDSRAPAGRGRDLRPLLSNVAGRQTWKRMRSVAQFEQVIFFLLTAFPHADAGWNILRQSLTRRETTTLSRIARHSATRRLEAQRRTRTNRIESHERQARCSAGQHGSASRLVARSACRGR